MDFGQQKTIRRYILWCTLMGVFFVWAFSSVRLAQAATGTNQTLNFQGRLLNAQGATVPDGYYNIQFKIYQDGDGQSVGNATGSPAGTLKWTESYLNVSSQGVRVQNGFLSVQLGSVTPFGTSVDWNQDTLWLSMNIGNTNVSCTPFTSCSPDGEMTPMQPMTSAVYALNASRLNGLTSAAFAQLAANQTWTGDNIFRPATNSTTAFQLQNSTSGISYMTGDSTNNQLVLGVASSLNGKLAFATAGGGTLTVVPTSNASNFTLTLPAETGTICSTGSVCSGYASTSALSGYVQLQGSSPGTAQTGNLNITGTGIFGGSLSVTGTSTFTGSITANGGLIVTAGQSVSVNGEAFTDLTGSGLSLSSGALTVDATSATGFFRNGGNSFGGSATVGTNDSNILAFKTNNSEVARFTTGGALQIGSTGTAGTVEKFRVNTPGAVDNNANTIITAGTSTSKALVIQGAASQSAVLLEVQSSTGTSLALIGGDGVIQGASLKISGGVGGGYLAKNYTVGTGGVAANDVVVLANDGGNSRAVTTTTARDTRVMGVALTSASSGGLTGIAYSGNYQVTATTAAVAIGDQLVTSTTAGQVMTDNNATTGIVGYATTAKSSGSAGLVSVYLKPISGQTNPNFGGYVGINIQGTAPTNRLNINAATTADAAAQALISTGSTGNKGLVVQRVSGQTANLIEVQSDTGNVLARFSSGGVLGINNNSVGTQSKLSINPNSTTDNSAVAQINTVNTTDKGLVIQGVAGQTSHLLQIQTSAGAVASGFTASGALYVASGSIYGNSALSIATGSASNQGVIIRGQASQTGNLMELQDNNGLVNGVFNAAGNQLTLGRVAASGTVTQGKLLFSDGTTDNYSLTLQSTTLTNNQTITFPNETGTVCTTGSVCSGYASSTGTVLLQGSTPGTAQTGNINVTGTILGGVFGANTTSFGTVQKFGVNTPTTADNTASAIIATGGTGNKGLLVQGVASQSANLVEYQNNSGTVLGGIGSAGQIFSGTTAPVSNNQAAIVAGASTRSGLIVRGAASQTADLFQLQDSSANVLSEFNASGYLGIGTTTASNKLTINTAATADSAAQALISTGGTGNKGLVIQGVASQSANVFEVQNNLGSAAFYVTSGGSVYAGNQNFLSAGGNSYVAATAGNFGIGTSTPNNKFSLFAPATADAAAQAIISTNGTANKGLVVQGVASQSANVFEVQNNAGSNLISVGSNGAFYASNSAAIHTTPLSGSILSVLGATGGSAPGIVYRASTSTGDAIQLQDSAGNVNAVFNAAGNQLTLGRVAASGTVTQGKLVLSDGTTDNYGLTLQSATLTSSQTITLPNETGTICTTGSVCTGYVGTSALAGYIQLQSTTPGTAQTGNLNITGAGIFGGTLAVTGTSTFTGLLTANGGITASGATSSINASSNNNTNINTGTSTGTVAIGNSASTTNVLGATNVNTSGTAATTIGNAGATVAIASSGLNVTTAGAVSGVTTLVTSSTINTNTFGASALTFSGAAPVISASTTNTGMTLQANGTGTLTLNNSGAGTVNIGTTNTTTIGIGNSAATTTILGTVNINNSGSANTVIGSGSTGTITVGNSASGTLTLQGGTSTTLVVNNGANRTTLAFASPSAIETVTVPNETGTICTTAASAACTAVYASAGGTYVNLQATTPGTAQTGNLNISGTGIFGTGVQIASSGTVGTVEKFRVNTPTTVDNAATAIVSTGGTSNKGLVIQGVAGQSAGSDLFEIQDSNGNVKSLFNASGGLSIGTTTYNAYLTVKGGSSVPTAALQAGSAQTADILQILDNNRNTLSKIDNNGQLISYGTGTQILGLATPVISTTPTGTSYYYVVTATNAAGETVASTSVGMTNNTSAITWAQVNGATGYKVYRNTSNSFVAGSLLLTTITNGSTVTYTDTGSATGAGLPPTSPTGTGLTLQGWSSQSGNALSIKNGAGSTTAGFTSGGRLFLASSAQFDGTTALMVSAGANTSVAQINRGLASQTADLLQFQDNNGLVNGAFNGTGNQLTLGRIAASGTVTQGKLLFADGTTDNYSLTLQSATLTANRTITLPNETGTVCTTGSICAGYAAAATSGAYLMQIPGSTADNTITPTAASTTALTVNGTSNGTPATALIVNQSGGVNGMALNLTNPGSTQTSGLVITRNASGGTTTNALSITQSAGTLTNGLTFSGTIGTGINFSGTNFTNLISATNFSVSNAGTITTNGGYTQSGTTTNTLTGATTLSATGTALSITNDATIGRLGVNASTFGTVQKLGVNTPGTVDNTASAIIATGGTNNRALVLQGAASQIADLMRFQDSSGNNHAAFSALGNQLSLGRTAGSGTVSQGKLIFSDGTTDNFALTLQSTTLTANQTITFPSETGTVCTTASVCSGYASAAGYVQLQATTPGTAQTGNINVTGTIMGGLLGANTSSFGTVQKLGVNTPAMVDNTAAAIISTGATGNKGLLIQGVSGQTANLFELQSYDGTFLVGANTSGQVGLSVSPGAGVGAKFAVSTAGIGFNSETTSTNDNTRLVLNNTSGTQTNGLLINRSGAGGTTTNLLNLTNTAGTATTGLQLTGTFTNLINATNFSVTNAGLLYAATDIVSGNGQFGTNGLSSGSSSSVAVNLHSGDISGTGSGASGALTLRTGNTTGAGGSGNILIDSGSAVSGATGSIGIGTTNSTALTVGNTGANTTTLIQGGSSATAIQINQALGGTINIGTTGTGSNVNLLCGASATCGIANNATTHSTILGSTSTTSATTVQAGSGGITLTGNITASGTYNTNTFSATALTFAGVNPVIGASTTNTGMTLQANGIGTLALNTTGAGTVNLGTANTTTLGIGNASSTNTILGSTTMTGTISVNTTGTAATTIGAGSGTAGNVVIQGGAGSSFSAQNTSGTSVLNFAAPSTAGIVAFQLPAGGTGGQTYQICTTFSVCAGYSASGSYANTALSNLASVAINTSLLPASNNAIDAGSTTLAFANGYFGTSVRTPLVSSADTTAASTASAATIFRSGNTSGATSGSGNVTLQSGNVATSGNSGSVTIDSGSTASGTTGTLSIGTTNSRSISIGNTSATTQTLIQGGSGGTAVSIQAATSGTINIGTTNANGIYIGATNNTNAITIGQSTDAAGETVNIGSGATTGNNIVAILSGSGTSGAATLRLGNNTRVTTIDLGNARPAAARTINIGNSTGTANTVVDTINIATNPTTVANGNTVNIASGTPTGAGTNTVTIGSTVGGSTTLIQGGTGATGIQIIQGTGGQVIVGSANTASTVTVQCGAGTSSNCGFGTNSNDHSTYMGSTTGTSNTVIQSGSGGINLNGAVTTNSTINGVTLSSTALTFSGANPVISASTSNTGMTVQSNGSGTLTLNSSGAGTVNLGTTNTTTIGIGNTTAATQTSIQGGTGVSALSMQVGSGGTISLGTTVQTTNVNVGNTSASTVTTIQGGTSTTALNMQVGNGGSLNIGTTAQTSVLNLGNTSASATTLINGGTGSTAIQMLQGTGGTITIGSTGAASVVNIQCGAGTSTSCGFGTNATDHTTTFGSTTGTSLTTIQAGSGGISLTQNTTLSANRSLTMASGTGQFAQTYTGTTTDAHAITASSLTTGTAFKVTSSNNTAANTSWTGSQFNATNAQSTAAATGYLYGTDFEFTQAATIAGNNESAVNIAIAATGGSPTDNTVSSILNIANNDDATGNLVQATDAIKITATTANNIINGINFNGTIQTNLIYTSSNNYTVTAAGAVTQAGNLTFTGANPTISATSTNANLTLQTNGTGTLAIATTGAGTINVGTTNTTTIGIGNTTAATQTLIQGGTGTTALGLQVGTGGTINVGTNVAGNVNIGTTVGTAATAITGGTGATAVSIQSGTGGTLTLGTTVQTSTLNMGNQSAASTTSISGGTGATAIQMLQGAGGTVTIGGTGTNSVVAIQCGAGTSTSCGFANNATDHTTTIGSATGVSLTAIQGGTGGITLTSGNTVETILTTGSTIKTNSNSTTAFRVVNSNNYAVLSVDTNAAGTNNTLRIMDGTATGAYLGLAYNSGTSTGTIAASTGTTAVGSGTGAISVLAGASSAITITANATSLWRTTAGTLTMQSGTSSDLIFTSGSGIVQISGSSVVKLGTSAGDPGTCTAGAIVYNTSTNTLRGCQGSTLAWNDLVNTTIPTMQQTYTASTGGTTPEVKLDTTRAAFDIQGDNAGSVTTLLNVRSGTGSGLGTAVVSVASSGTATFQSSTSQDLLLVDATALEIQIGSGTAHSTDAVKLVLDNYQSATAGAEPTEADGAMYYDADSNQFRCSVRGFWSSCAINSIESSYVFEDEFLSGASQTAAASSLVGVGALGWNISTTTSCAVAYNQNVTGTGPGVQHDHPGTVRLTTNTSNGAACVLTQGGTAAGSPTLNQIIDRGDTFKSAIAISTATGFMRVGWSNQSAAGAPTSGAWWQYTGGNLQYCYANNAAAVCATATTLAVNTWAEVEIHVSNVTTGSVSITFTSSINGTTTTNTTTANFDPGTTNRLTPGGSCVNNTTTAQNCYIDYIQWSGYNVSGNGIRD